MTRPAGGIRDGALVCGTSQLVIDDGHKTVVGATFTGPGLQELLHSAIVAICGGVTIDRLWHAVPSFPPSAKCGFTCSRHTASDPHGEATTMGSSPIDYAVHAGPLARVLSAGAARAAG